MKLVIEKDEFGDVHAMHESEINHKIVNKDRKKQGWIKINRRALDYECNLEFRLENKQYMVFNLKRK